MKNAIVGAMFSAVLLTSVSGQAQTQALAPGEADPGVRPTRMIDRAEVRASRVEVQAGATRRVHTHDDVEYHLWIPIEGRFELTIGSDPPIVATPGQAYFMKRGTPHGFKNIGTSAGAALEIFVKQTTVAERSAEAAQLDLAQLLSLLSVPVAEF